MELTYHWEGDYLIPDLTIGEKQEPIGKYGMLRKTFLKENRAGWYQGMMLSGELNGHLAEIEKAATERMEILVERLLENGAITELDRATVVEFIDKIYVFEDKHIEIVYKFSGEFDGLFVKSV